MSTIEAIFVSAGFILVAGLTGWFLFGILGGITGDAYVRGQGNRHKLFFAASILLYIVLVLLENWTGAQIGLPIGYRVFVAILSSIIYLGFWLIMLILVSDGDVTGHAELRGP